MAPDAAAFRFDVAADPDAPASSELTIGQVVGSELLRPKEKGAVAEKIDAERSQLCGEAPKGSASAHWYSQMRLWRCKFAHEQYNASDSGLKKEILAKLGIWGNSYGPLLFKRPVLWVTAGICALLIFFVTSIYGFLAVTHPLGEGILVVEGWIPSKTLAKSVDVFNSGGYQCLVVVGGPIQGAGSVSGHPTTYADLSASRLEQLGFDAKKLIKINVPAVSSEHTLTGAADVKRWLERSGTKVCCVDILTAGVHARKSWILSRYALGDSYRVGIIAGPESAFDPKYWLVSRRGTWSVVRNLAGYVYYKLWILFNRKASPRDWRATDQGESLTILENDIPPGE